MPIAVHRLLAASLTTAVFWLTGCAEPLEVPLSEEPAAEPAVEPAAAPPASAGLIASLDPQPGAAELELIGPGADESPIGDEVPGDDGDDGNEPSDDGSGDSDGDTGDADPDTDPNDTDSGTGDVDDPDSDPDDTGSSIDIDIDVDVVERPGTGVDISVDVSAGPDRVSLLPSQVFGQSVAGARSTQYSDAWNQWRDLGYHPNLLSAVRVDGANLYSGVWTDDPNVSAWFSQRGMTWDEYGDYWTELKDAGYRVLDLDAHVVDGTVYLDGIWVKERRTRGWASRRGLSESGLRDALTDYEADGLRPSRINSYVVDGEVRYTAVWVTDDGSDWALLVDSTSEEYSAAWSAHRDAGLRPADISSHDLDGARFNGLWVEDDSHSGWWSRRNLTEAAYRDEAILRKSQNYVLVDLDAYTDAGDLRFSAIWRRGEAHNQLSTNAHLDADVVAQLEALIDAYEADHGHLGFYVEDITSGEMLAYNEHEHFYMASTAKVLIGTGVLSMIDNGERFGRTPLTLDTTVAYDQSRYRQARDVTGSGMVPGTNYTIEQYLRWMINDSSTASTDLLTSVVGREALNEYLTADLGLINVGEVTSICELDQRILSTFDTCFLTVPCDIFEAWWRDGNTSQPGYATYASCLGSNRPSGSAAYDDIYNAYYATLANSITPAEYGRYWRMLLDGQLLSEELTYLMLDVLDDTGNSYVDDNVLGMGYFDGFGGKHGGKRSAQSWVGLSWYRNGDADDFSTADRFYSVSIFTENWADSGRNTEAKAIITQALGLIYQALDGATD